MGEVRAAGGQNVELRLLGPLEALRDGRPVSLGGPKPAGLLAVLALEVGRVVSVDLLVDALWPGTPPETAPHAIQVYVSQLRKALGADAVARRGAGYALELDPERVDAHRFARLVVAGREALASGDMATASTVLRESLELWRGPALADFVYEPYAQSDSARLEELRLLAVEARIDADLALGRQVDLVSELEALVQAHPLREHARAQLMLALYRSGRQADALAAYRAARETLVDSLGIEPGPELRELEAAILRQDEGLLLPDAAPGGPAMQFRRLVTIVFVDVVDSIVLGEMLDAETLGSVQRRYFEAVSAAVVRHGGVIEKYAGDAVLAAFGVPISHEDDALRAARAALDVRAGVAALSEQLAAEHGFGLEVRIGVAAGEVVATTGPAGHRMVAGDPVGIAARLQYEAGPGEIVVGDVVARLVDHAARLEPLGPVAIPGREKTITTFRLVEVVPAAPAFERRLDAPFVGRKRELAALRKALKRAIDDGSPRAAVIVGPPGIGKSRLASELARRARGVRVLAGRCLSYGEGITYWPLREIVERAPASSERDAVLEALDTDVPPAAPEIALRFRELCTALARAKPLLLVIDDVHWAEQTLLDLLELLVDRGRGPLLLVCIAREELLDERPQFLEGRESCERRALDVLPTDEAEALLDALGGGVLETGQRALIAEAAEGNPFFVEQLLAHAVEGGLAEGALPPTVQALLAARLDRLGPGERAVLERGAVIGKQFTAADLTALLEPEAAPTVDAHLRTLSDRGFVRPHEEGGFAFRHVLVQDAVYRSAPKRLRAELHERFADRLEHAYPELSELDEFVGYHLEQAFKLRTELGESDRRTAQLAEDAGRRLGEAGVRASKRGDLPAATGLLERATSILPSHAPLRGDLLCELGISLDATGASEEAIRALEAAVEEASASGERRTDVRARMELEYVRLPRTPGATADALLDAASAAIPVLEAAEDFRCLGRAWLLVGWVHGGRRGRHRAREEAAERALVYYKQSTWPASTCAGEIASALYYGPTPVSEAIPRCEALLESEITTRYGRANVETYLGGLVAQRGDVDRARALLATARATYDELGQLGSAAAFSGVILGDVELMADDARAAEEVLRWVCDELSRAHAYSRLASRAGDLAESLYRQERFDEAAEWVAVGEMHSASDDVDALVLWMPVKAKLAALCGDVQDAIAIASRALELAETSDALNRRASAWIDMATVRVIAGDASEASAAFERAIELYERKGNVLGETRVRAMRGELEFA